MIQGRENTAEAAAAVENQRIAALASAAAALHIWINTSAVRYIFPPSLF